ncbi:hypothetical protein PoB_006014800 [Plakobranchus ocellatus]|uniref:Secreted protein n=1 Tax=Plakobranchus ocellatus TaxID=259542 RepID=A0AAV4CP32_9GAST|nr:hypothetical protein PoB_006014800 [Plakobranchus ocellatus]
MIRDSLIFSCVGSTVACESALRSAGTLLSRVRAPLPAPWPDGGPESLRSPCCGLVIYKNPNPTPDLFCNWSPKFLLPESLRSPCCDFSSAIL